MSTSKIVLITLGAFWALFIIAMCVIFCVKGSTPDTLIQCVLGGSGVEVAAITAIKISKVLSGKDDFIVMPGEEKRKNNADSQG